MIFFSFKVIQKPLKTSAVSTILAWLSVSHLELNDDCRET